MTTPERFVSYYFLAQPAGATLGRLVATFTFHHQGRQSEVKVSRVLEENAYYVDRMGQLRPTPLVPWTVENGTMIPRSPNGKEFPAAVFDEAVGNAVDPLLKILLVAEAEASIERVSRGLVNLLHQEEDREKWGVQANSFCTRHMGELLP